MTINPKRDWKYLPPPHRVCHKIRDKSQKGLKEKERQRKVRVGTKDKSHKGLKVSGRSVKQYNKTLSINPKRDWKLQQVLQEANEGGIW